MKRALISDIHSNLEGLEAVLADIRQQGIKEIYCLGDIIGYGPNPCECIDLIMKCDVCSWATTTRARCSIPKGSMRAPSGRSSGRATSWRTRAEPAVAPRSWEFLGELPRNRRENGVLYVHGSARNPLNEYVFPEDIYNPRKMEKIFALIENACFQGHTHVPGIFTQSLNFFSPEEMGLPISPDRREDDDQRRLGRPAARRRPPCLLCRVGRRHAHVSSRGLSRRDHARQDLRHPGVGELSGRPAVGRPIEWSLRLGPLGSRSACQADPTASGRLSVRASVRRGLEPAVIFIEVF